MMPIIRSLSLFFIFLAGGEVFSQDTWPKEIPFSGGGAITIYQPQPERLYGDDLDLRAAVSIRRSSGDEPVFGAMWVLAKLDSRGNNSVVSSVMVRQSKFAEDENISASDFKKAVEKGFPSLRVQFSKESLQAAIKQELGEESLKNDPPLIIYRDKPTTLIVLDGEPMEEKDEYLKLTRVVNTPYLIVKNPDDNKYYLYGGSFWYSSSRVKDGWTNVKKLPSRIKSLDTKMKEEEKKASTENDNVSKFSTPTTILVVTEPAELIQTEGKPTYQSVQGSPLLYVNNSLDEIFKDIDTQKNYILIAGRWYRSSSLNGPWEYVSQEALPRAFADIPAGSEKDGVLASVGGTDEANDAVMEAQIPQTAKVDRATARVEVNYDGEPRFERIENTNLSVAENSNITVMRAANNMFYALENGIWFISNNAFGPWQVANERPSDVDRIPPSNSAYNARYVHIYETTPQFVYVGYTQGYMGNYIYGPTVVWGTGWHYRPWRGRYYRPRPATWGFGMHYNPWTGWSMSFGLGFNVGWYHYGYSRPHYSGGWFGPPAYRPPHRPWGWNGGYYGNRPGYNGPDYPNRPRPNVVVNRPGRSYNQPGSGYSRPIANNNLYRDRKYVVATRNNVFRPVTRPNPGRPSNGNNVGRPDVGRPGTGNNPGTLPNVGRPSTGSGNIALPDRSRPTIGNGQNGRPNNGRPATGSGNNTLPDRNRPAIGNGQNERPDVTRPAIGSGNSSLPDRARPSIGNGQNNRQPVTRPVQRPVESGRQPSAQPGRERQPVNRTSVNPGQARPAPTRQPTTNQPRQSQPSRQQGERGNPRGQE
ncbi:hypothetical protein SAMN04487995_5761 [Dyadobacter koreensis]|uniref:Carbohydrate-binding family V/XII n=1 Tax=Dyadobacter koreensis TaxID=408657 RepID=A0A1H7AHT9_9BACT|nr:hypothetical protein [Dyadobacter koreensis]SEJ65201.1 hypothetical protein SAMN04487995_5761 [Dyadobacter koreensis]